MHGTGYVRQWCHAKVHSRDICDVVHNHFDVVTNVITSYSIHYTKLYESGSAEDGFLAMREIAALDLQGGFVTLSACQTGLGRVFRGEGVVGLAQAFLDAGAGGMAVTLWSVSDASAPAFMSRAYAALGRGASFAGAFADARRAFIRGEAGERFARPSHWAPFRNNFV